MFTEGQEISDHFRKNGFKPDQEKQLVTLLGGSLAQVGLDVWSHTEAPPSSRLVLQELHYGLSNFLTCNQHSPIITHNNRCLLTKYGHETEQTNYGAKIMRYNMSGNQRNFYK